MSKKSKRTKAVSIPRSGLLESPARLMLIFVVTIFFIELAVMKGIRYLDINGVTIDFIDSLILVVLLLPEFYFLLYRPLVKNISERAAEEVKNNLMASVFIHAKDGIIITDSKRLIIEVNKSFSEITGYGRQEVIGKNPSILSSGRQGKEFYQLMWKTIHEEGSWSGEVWNRHKTGVEYEELLNISAIYNADGVVVNYIASFSDITQTKEYKRQLEMSAHYDSLTKLPNRTLLAHNLRIAIDQSNQRNLSVAVVYIDLDGFKVVNDTYGHGVGDELLVNVSCRMKEVLRDGDTIARIGGDEFVVVLAGLTKFEECEPVLRRLLETTSEPILIQGHSVQVSISIGVAVYPSDEVDADLLLRHADQAMYVAKQSGKNRWCIFDVVREIAVQTKRDSLDEIYMALKQGEFVLYYQPKVNMATNEVVGAEALIRWNHKEKGLLSPLSFLSVIENHQISLELGEWVINEALRQLSVWHAEGIKISVSVNVCAYQLHDHAFASTLSRLLSIYPDVPPNFLEVEILETSALEDIVRVSSIMQDCHHMGVRFALDDFGTGYSSLTYLKKLPVDVLKIDQSFVRDITSDAENLSIIKAVIGLASAFNREVVAEGVETVEQGVMLLSLGCNLAQGYGIARPMRAEDFPLWMSTWKTYDRWKETKNGLP